MRQTGRKLLRRLARWLIPTFAAAALASCAPQEASQAVHSVGSDSDWAEVVLCVGPTDCPPSPGYYHTTASGTEQWFAWSEYAGGGWSTDDPIEAASPSASAACGVKPASFAFLEIAADPAPTDLDLKFGKLFAPGASGGKGVQPAEKNADNSVKKNPTVWPDGSSGRKQVIAANAAQIQLLVQDAERKGGIVNFVTDVDGKVWVAAECDDAGKYPPAAKDKALGHPTIATMGRIAGEVHYGKPAGAANAVFYINNDSGRYSKPFKDRTQAMLDNVKAELVKAGVPVASTVWVPLNKDAK